MPLTDRSLAPSLTLSFISGPLSISTWWIARTASSARPLSLEWKITPNQSALSTPFTHTHKFGVQKSTLCTLYPKTSLQKHTYSGWTLCFYSIHVWSPSRHCSSSIAHLHWHIITFCPLTNGTRPFKAIALPRCPCNEWMRSCLEHMLMVLLKEQLKLWMWKIC